MVEEAKKMKREAEKEMKKEKGGMEMGWGGLEERAEESRSKRRR